MQNTKTLVQREKELQALLATTEGKVELRALAERYAESGGQILRATGSLVTFVLVHERQSGLISG